MSPIDPAGFAPAAEPTLDQQRDALRKGLGRARLWADAGRLADGPLLEACLQNFVFDVQCEAPRGDWLWGLIRAAGAADRLRGPMLAALADLGDDRAADQLCTLAYRYAAAGDGAFRDRLRAIVAAQPCDDGAPLGEEELIRLDGAPGFLLAAHARGERLAGRAWDWGDGSVARDAIEALGEEAVARLLAEATDPAVIRFAGAWRADRAADEGRQRDREDRPKSWERPVAEVFRAAAIAGPRPWSRSWLMSWGRHADEADLRLVADRLRATGDPVEVKNLLYVFGRIAMPNFDPALLDLCGHADPELRRRAFMACGQVAHPAVRARGLAELARGVEPKGAVSLLVRNFAPGDEARVLAALRVPDDADDWHATLRAVLDLLQINPDADPSSLGLVLYTLNPCTNCRGAAVEILLDRGVAPAWLRTECRHDADQEIRERVATAGTGDPAPASN